MMILTCVHCHKALKVPSKKLGTTGACPLCGKEMRFDPAAQVQVPPPRPRRSTTPPSPAPRPALIAQPFAPPPPLPHRDRPGVGRDRVLAVAAATALHALLLGVCFLVPWEFSSGNGPPQVVLADSPFPQLEQAKASELRLGLPAEEVAVAEADDAGAQRLNWTLRPRLPAEDVGRDVFISPLVARTDVSLTIDLAPLRNTGALSEDTWQGLLDRLRAHGLDVVICFDSTGSMGSEINAVKGQITRIGTTLLKLVPKTRISLCTYRDFGGSPAERQLKKRVQAGEVPNIDTMNTGEGYVVRGIGLTDKIGALQKWLNPVRAHGGGDEPEAVEEGLRWAIHRNKFRPLARKVILVFGDARPHPEDMPLCLRLAGKFHKDGGIVSTITCRKATLIPEFQQIAKTGGGEAFSVGDEKLLVQRLMVLVFGSRHEGKVLEAFKLLGK